MKTFCGRVRLGVLGSVAGLFWLSSILSGCGDGATKDVPIVFDADGTSHRIAESELPQYPAVPAEGITVYVSDNRSQPEPVSGADVVLILNNAEQLQQTTDSNGTCHFSDVPTGKVGVSVDQDDYPPNRGVTTFQGSSNLLVVKLDANNEVQCKVYAADTGEPVPQFDLLFKSGIPGISPRWRKGFVSVQPGDDGIYTARGIGMATRIVVRADGFLPFQLWLTNKLAPPRPVFEFPLKRASTIVGKVTDADGNPIQGVRIVPAIDAKDGFEVGARTQEDGTYTVHGVAETPALFVALHKEFAPAPINVPKIDPGSQVRIDVQLIPGVAVQGSVFLDQNPVRDAGIEIRVPAIHYRHDHETGNDGSYGFKHVAPGLITLIGRIDPREVSGLSDGAPRRLAIRQIAISPDTTPTQVDFHFTESGGLVEGFVRFEETPAVAQVSVTYARDDYQIFLRTQADDGGWYQLTGLPPGRYLIGIEAAVPESISYRRAKGHSRMYYDTMHRYFAIDVPENGYVQKDFDLRSGGIIRGTVTGLPDDAEDAVVRVGYLWNDAQRGEILPDLIPISEDGTFSVNGLPAGTYRLEPIFANIGRHTTDDFRRDGSPVLGHLLDYLNGSPSTKPHAPSKNAVEVAIDGEGETQVELKFPSAVEKAN